MTRTARRMSQGDPVPLMDRGLPGISRIDEQTRQNCSSLLGEEIAHSSSRYFADCKALEQIAMSF